MTVTRSSRTTGQRAEGLAQVAILLAVGVMAGAASFTHVHDWTMHNAPAGTPGWFGWANAVISELTPLAAGLEIRRRRGHGQPVGYPMIVLVAAVTLSLSAQVAEAKPSPSGWLLSAVPALAFLALAKLVISRPATPAPAPVPVRAGGEDQVVTDPDHATVPAGPVPAPTVPTVPAVSVVPVAADAFARLNGGGGTR